MVQGMAAAIETRTGLCDGRELEPQSLFRRRPPKCFHPSAPVLVGTGTVWLQGQRWRGENRSAVAPHGHHVAPGDPPSGFEVRAAGSACGVARKDDGMESDAEKQKSRNRARLSRRRPLGPP